MSTGNRHKDGDYYRTETLHITGKGGLNNPKTGNPYTTTGNKDQRGYDDLFVDWQTDMNADQKKDKDLNFNNVKSDYDEWAYKLEDNRKLSGTNDVALTYRIHGNINVDKDDKGNFPYHVRDADFFNNNKAALDEVKRIYKEGEGKNKLVDEDGKELSDEEFIKRVAKEPPDPLYVRIESEPVHDGGGLNNDDPKGNNASSVHQIIINLNVSNAVNRYADGTEFAGEYSDRPMFFYYTGPTK